VRHDQTPSLRLLHQIQAFGGLFVLFSMLFPADCLRNSEDGLAAQSRRAPRTSTPA